MKKSREADFRSKETGVLYELLGSIGYTGKRRFVLRNLSTGKEITISVTKILKYFDKLYAD